MSSPLNIRPLRQLLNLTAGTARGLRHWLVWLVMALLALQVFFVGRIAVMAWSRPHSTAFMRSEIWRRSHDAKEPMRTWQQRWVDAPQISVHLKRAVIASEDDGFANHTGVDWAAMESAWSKNRQRQAKAGASNAMAKIVGGSTITQQLAKNLLLSGERSLFRKSQELVLTFALEALLSKARILEIYLNSVEWGDGVFGAEAAAQRYFGVSAAQLSPEQAARLAVMLPAPKTFERRPNSAYLNRRTETILGRMAAAAVPKD